MRVKNTISILVIITMVGSIFMFPSLSGDNTVDAASKKVKLTYNVNSGSFISNKYKNKKSYTKKIKKGKKIGKLPSVSKQGYKLVGWYTKKTGGKKVTKKTKIKKKITVYARWAPNSYNIVFKGRNGTKDMIKSIKYDSRYSSVMSDPVMPGNKFNGWYTAPTGGTEVKPEDVYKNTNSTWPAPNVWSKF